MIALVYFICNKQDENVLLQNPTLKYPDNLLLVCGNNYSPSKINKHFIRGESIFIEDYEDEIKKLINEDFYLILYPYESINNFEILEIEEKNYYIRVESQYPKANLDLDKTNSFEIRLKNKNYLFTNINDFSIYEGILIYSYLDNFPNLEENKKNDFSKLLENKKESSEIISFLIKKGVLKFTDEELIKIIRSENINAKNRLELVLYLAKKFTNNIEYRKTIDLLNIEYQYFGNSISVNYNLGILHHRLEEYNKSVYFFKNTINLFKEKSFYKEDIFSYSICTYLSNYYIGEAYFNLKKYKEAKEYFETSITFNSNMPNAIDYIYEIDEIVNNKDPEEELKFTCTMCGNSCRNFDINVTHDDVINILKNRPDLNINDFVELKYLSKSAPQNGDIVSWGKDETKLIMLLKKKPGSKDCIFLENNLCTINKFKPLACRAWPFDIREKDGKIRWGNSYRDFIKNVCAYKLSDKTDEDKKNIKEDLLKLHQSRSEYHSLIREWNTRTKEADKIDRNVFFNFFISNNLDKEKENITNNLINLLMINDNVIALSENPFISIYQTKKENSLFMSFFVKQKMLKQFKEKKAMEFVLQKLKSLFSYHINYPEENFKFYINSVMLYLYFLPYESIYENIYDNTNIIATKEKLETKRLSIEELSKNKIKNIKNSFDKLLFEANKSIKAMNYKKSMNIHKSIIDKELPSLLYWFNKRDFLPSEIQVLDITSKGLYKLLSSINSYELNNEGQTKLNNLLRKHFDNLLKNSRIISTK